MNANTIGKKQPEVKSPLLSLTIWGGVLLAVLDVADILTGDPWSLNGAVKWAGLLLGTTLVFLGRWKANKKLSWSSLKQWFTSTDNHDDFWDVTNEEKSANPSGNPLDSSGDN